ncbi:MAG: alpha-amylase [Chloroflexi bacterium]|nr:alpha-amylase [Chloroflexota bacterium]
MTQSSGPGKALWWQRGIVYQIYPRSFRDTNGDGIGDLPGVSEKLDYLAETLGIDAIWLSPFYPSPMADFGYDISDYTDVDPIFGTLADFDELVRRAHRRDIRVIVDFVPNHSSDRHPWFLESRSARDNPRRDWYIWRDVKPDGYPPNNWLANFGGRAWEWDEATGQYYLHSFLKEQPDLNWRNPEVRAALLDVLRFWMERGVDGFRIDVATLIMKDPQLRDNPLNPDLATTSPPIREFSTQRHIHDRSHPDVHEAFRAIRRLLDEYGEDSPRMAVGEIYEFDWPTWASYYGANLDELHLPFNFAFIRLPWTAPSVRQIVAGVEGAIPPGAWPNYVLGNHDQHRVVTRLGPAQARVAMMLLLTLRGTPTMYYGEEIGMHDVFIPPDLVQDPFEKNVPGIGLGRDPERTPMQWDASPNAGFCPPAASPWLPIADDFRRVNVAAELDDPRSFLSLTRKLIAVRRAGPLATGAYRPIDGVPDDCVTDVREEGARRQLVALNFSTERRLIDVPGEHGRVLVSTHLDREGDVDLRRFELRGDEGCVVEIG